MTLKSKGARHLTSLCLREYPPVWTGSEGFICLYKTDCLLSGMSDWHSACPVRPLTMNYWSHHGKKILQAATRYFKVYITTSGHLHLGGRAPQKPPLWVSPGFTAAAASMGNGVHLTLSWELHGRTWPTSTSSLSQLCQGGSPQRGWREGRCN